MAVTISMVTWNSEHEAPSAAFVNRLKAYIAVNNPDILVLALQETSSISANKLDYSLRAAWDADANAAIPIPVPYVLAHEVGKIGGLTRSSRTQTRVAIFHKAVGVPANTSFSAGLVGAKGKSVSGTSSAIRTGGDIKGGIHYAVDRFPSPGSPLGVGLTPAPGERRIAFIGAHLDAGSEVGRGKQIRGLLNAITTGATPLADGPVPAGGVPGVPGVPDTLNDRLRTQFDAVFFMGDLNYRLKAIPNTVVGGQSMSEVITATDMAGLIDNPADRLSLLTNLDSLEDSLLKKNFGFTFNNCRPQANGGAVAAHPFPPTYKIKYNNVPPFAFPGGNIPVGAQAAAIGGAAGAVENLYRLANPAIATPPHPAKFFNEDRGQYDLGWLDRIGWITPVGGAVNVVSQETFTGIISDHLPVMLTVTLV